MAAGGRPPLRLDLLVILAWILAPAVWGNLVTNYTSDCRDLHPGCEEWAMEDKCWGSDPHYYVHKCPASCGGCPKSKCDDSEAHRHECDSLAHRGFCRHNRKWMIENCFLSCGFCRQEEIRNLQKTMVTTPKPSPQEACKDNNPACPDWALDGQCWDNSYFMGKNCKSSCWSCPKVHHCVDREKYKDKCPVWTKNGVCAKSKTWMYHNCYRACGYCRRESIRVANLETLARTTPIPSTECRENHTKCQKWARQGECWGNPFYMTKNCQQSCGTCPNKYTNCTDSRAYARRCPSLAKRGYCTKNPAWMVANCYRSCGFCRGTGNLTIGPPYIPPKYPDGRLCRDHHPGCARWSIEEQCWNNPFYMSPNCGISCRTCAEVYDCHDKLEFKHECGKWVATDFCKKSKDWMKVNCYKSCGYCMHDQYYEKYGNKTNAIRRLYSEAVTIIPLNATSKSEAPMTGHPLGIWAVLQAIVILSWVCLRA